MRFLNRSALAVVAALLAATTVAGCTSSSKGGPSASASGANKSPAKIAGSPGPGLPSGVVGATSLPASAPNNIKLRKNVAITSCKATSSGWAAVGTASNPGHKSVDYKITVYFTTTTATVIGSAQITTTVKAGGKSTWQAAGRFTAPAKTLCALVGVG